MKVDTSDYNKYQFVIHYNLIVLGCLAGLSFIPPSADPMNLGLPSVIFALLISTLVFVGLND